MDFLLLVLIFCSFLSYFNSSILRNEKSWYLLVSYFNSSILRNEKSWYLLVRFGL